MARTWSLLLAVAWFTAAPHAQAQDKNDGFSLDDPESTEEPAPPPAAAEEEPALLGDEQALQEEAAPQEKFRESTDPYEDPKQSYFFVGAGWRYVRMPAWSLEWFLEAAPSVGTAGSFFGEFGYRKDGFQIGANLGWMKWNFTGPFQLSGDPDQDTEWIDAKWNLLMMTATVTWSTSFTDWMALEYGFEAGAALIFGDMTRTEAYKRNGQWAPCPGYVGSAALPDALAIDEQRGGYCDAPIPEGGSVTAPLVTNSADEIGAHYGVKAPHGIANKGIPRGIPVLGPRLSLRFKPIHQLVLRVDVPLPILPLGFMGGLSAQYGF
jgi:hypothetical protein